MHAHTACGWGRGAAVGVVAPHAVRSSTQQQRHHTRLQPVACLRCAAQQLQHQVIQLGQVSWSPGLSEVLQQVEAKFPRLKANGASSEDFIKLIRAQVHAVSTSQAFQSSMMRPDVCARLQAQMSLSVQELAAAKWMFGLLDFDNDGKVSLEMYKEAQGIEAYVYEDKIEDADAASPCLQRQPAQWLPQHEPVWQLAANAGPGGALVSTGSSSSSSSSTSSSSSRSWQRVAATGGDAGHSDSSTDPGLPPIEELLGQQQQVRPAATDDDDSHQLQAAAGTTDTQAKLTHTSSSGGGDAADDGGSSGDTVGVRLALQALRWYKSALSPLMASTCRFQPTCSQYAMDSYRRYGVAKGTVLTAWRLLRCNPLGPSGYDPTSWPPKGLEPLFQLPGSAEVAVVLGAAAVVRLTHALLFE